MKRSHFLGLCAAAGSAALPAAARAQYAPYPMARQLNLAVIAPLSGADKALGEQVALGVHAAVDEYNRMNGALTTAYAVRVFDDLNTTAQARTNVDFAASDPSVIAAIAGSRGSVTLDVLPEYANRSLPAIVPASTLDAITQRGYRNVWRLPTKDSTEGALIASYLGGKYKNRAAIAVAQDGGYGLDVARGFIDRAKSMHVNADGYVFPDENPDYTAAAARIVSRTPALVVLCGSTAALGPVIPALRAAGYTGDFAGSEGFYDPKTLETYGSTLKDALVSSSFPPLERVVDQSNLLQDFRAQYSINAISAFSYAAAQIVIAAAQRIGGTNRLAMITAMRAPVAYRTIVGSFQFTAYGDPIDPDVYFYRVDGDRFTYAGPAHVNAFVL